MPAEFEVLPRGMEEDLKLDKIRAVYNQAQAAADAAALSLQQADGERDPRRHCQYAAQEIGKAPGRAAKQLEGTSYLLWGKKEWTLYRGPIRPGGRWVFTCADRSVRSVIKMGLRQLANGGYQQTCTEADPTTRGQSSMVLPSTELFHDASGGAIFVLQPKVLFTAKNLFRMVNGPVSLNMAGH